MRAFSAQPKSNPDPGAAQEKPKETTRTGTHHGATWSLELNLARPKAEVSNGTFTSDSERALAREILNLKLPLEGLSSAFSVAKLKHEQALIESGVAKAEGDLQAMLASTGKRSEASMPSPSEEQVKMVAESARVFGVPIELVLEEARNIAEKHKLVVRLRGVTDAALAQNVAEAQQAIAAKREGRAMYAYLNKMVSSELGQTLSEKCRHSGEIYPIGKAACIKTVTYKFNGVTDKYYGYAEHWEALVCTQNGPAAMRWSTRMYHGHQIDPTAPRIVRDWFSKDKGLKKACETAAGIGSTVSSVGQEIEQLVENIANGRQPPLRVDYEVCKEPTQHPGSRPKRTVRNGTIN